MKLLFVHGAGGGADLWHFQTTYFPDSIAVDLPGHPSGQGFNTIEDYAGWVEDYIRTREMIPLILIGHSMGGAICQWLALHRPEMLLGLVLVSTGARLRVSPLVFEALEGDYGKAVDFLVGSSFGPQAPPELLQEAKRLRLRVPSDVVRGDFEACDKFDVMDQLRSLTLPTLIICGTEDKLTPMKYGQYLHSQIPGSLLEEIPGAGHNVMLEKPLEFNRELEGFLKRLETKSHAAE